MKRKTIYSKHGSSHLGERGKRKSKKTKRIPTPEEIEKYNKRFDELIKISLYEKH